MRKHRAAPAAIATLLCLLAAAPALGHGGDANFRSVVEALRPDVPGLSVEVIDYDADMELVDTGGHEVVVYGYEGEPYARILPDGTVQENRRSPATYMNVDRYAESPVPERADPEAPPVWRTVDSNGVLRWHDHRMHYMAKGTPPQVKDQGERTVIFDYEIPLRVDGRPGAIAGTLYWVGPADTSKAPFIVVAAVLLLAGGVAVVILRRRRGGRGEDGGGRGEAREAW